MTIATIFFLHIETRHQDWERIVWPSKMSFASVIKISSNIRSVFWVPGVREKGESSRVESRCEGFKPFHFEIGVFLILDLGLRRTILDEQDDGRSIGVSFDRMVVRPRWVTKGLSDELGLGDFVMTSIDVGQLFKSHSFGGIGLAAHLI
ncbi:hypothetical protein L6452_01539 [Arctium lappa]|uniref:Uncharacterized protein n=1 Tax=Arctium lappa TaxID=4217 RepID=A0ACB9FH56_ARCLA|nr:hypothetical protein L6452_01539 [Arctium lappa]